MHDTVHVGVVQSVPNTCTGTGLQKAYWSAENAHAFL